MNNYIMTIGVILIIANLVYVVYSFIFKKSYYDNIFITLAICIVALVMEPINASFKFNAKYGFSILDLVYYGLIMYAIVTAVIRNNNFYMFNMSWETFYKIIKEVFRKKGIDIYYRMPTIYIENTNAKIELGMNLFSNNVIMVKFTNVSSIINLKELVKATSQEFNKLDTKEYKTARYFYLFANIFITILLLANFT